MFKTKQESYACYLFAIDWWYNFMMVGSKIEKNKNSLDHIVADQFFKDIISSFITKSIKFSNSYNYRLLLYYLDLDVDDDFVDDN